MRAPTFFLALGLTGCVLGSADGQHDERHHEIDTSASSGFDDLYNGWWPPVARDADSPTDDNPDQLADGSVARSSSAVQHANLERDDTATEAMLPTDLMPSGQRAPPSPSDHGVIECCAKGLACCPGNWDNTKRDFFDNLGDFLHNAADKGQDLGEEGWDRLKDVFNLDDWKREVEPEAVSDTPAFLCRGPCTDCAAFEQFIGNGAIPTPGAALSARDETRNTPGFVSTTIIDGTPAVFSVQATSPQVDVLKYGDSVTTVTLSEQQQSEVPGLDLSDLSELTIGWATTLTVEDGNGSPVTEVLIVTATDPIAGVGIEASHGRTSTTTAALADVLNEAMASAYGAAERQERDDCGRRSTSVDTWTDSAGVSNTATFTYTLDGRDAEPTEHIESAGSLHNQKRQASVSTVSVTTTTVPVSTMSVTTTVPVSTVPVSTVPVTTTISDPMMQTTDADGNTIWVTRTGDWASTTVTLSAAGLTLTVFPNTTSPSPSTVTTTVSAAQPTLTKIHTTIITETMFDPFQRCTKKANPYLASTTTVAYLFGKEIFITNATQTLNNTVFVVPPSPQATLFPLSRYENYVLALLDLAQNEDALNKNARDILDADMGDVRDRHPSINWVMVAELGYVLQQAHNTIDRELAMKFATIWVLEHPEVSGQSKGAAASSGRDTIAGLGGTLITVTPPVQSISAPSQLTKRDGALAMTEANINGHSFPITRSTQTHNGNTVYVVATTTPFNYASAARHNQKYPKSKIMPPACEKGGNKTQCKIAKCMMKHYKPINITTVFPAAMLGDRGETAYGYFTHSTELTGAHFGKTKASATYYPTKVTASIGKDMRLTPTASVQVPSGVNLQRLRGIQGDTKVWDHKSCCKRCQWEAANPINANKWKWIAGAIGLLSLILALLSCLCCYKLFRRHRAKTRADPNRSYRRRLGLLGRRRNDPTAVVVDPATGQPMAEVVPTPVHDPAPATNPDHPGPTTGTEGPTEGRGTLGRKAEEGRGPVHFAEGTAPAAGQPKVVTTPSGEQVVTTAPTGAPPTEHPASGPTENVEPINARHDGANDGVPTGRQTADMGSMRGRRKNRHDGAHPDLLNVRF
ncbi:hypothetical protein LTR36_000900 [Oleoguttula mirabilis]|uniref:Uncharacterized protein n=1 Tax=Oleoguttula mirabilis TaxID=1507867 RepID=A0AAV9JNW1_9PEZI|nr:hypothetical protein LTR36_000900 [Oleoguttula mirabilis]